MRSCLAVALAVCLPTLAVAETYKCETTNFGRGGWVPSELILTYDPQKATATAYDPMIHSLHERPISVKWKPRSETSSTFRWTLKGLKASNGGKGTNSFKVTLFTQRNAFSLSGRRHGYDNVISASGSCKRIK